MTTVSKTVLVMIVATMVMPCTLCALQVDVDLVNGDLETGDLTGWTFVNDDGSFTNGKGEVVAVLPGDPDDKGEYVYEGNDYVQMLSASGDVWQGDTEYTVSLDIWRDPDMGANPFVSVNPANDNAPWSNWSSSSPWRFGIGGLNFQLKKGWDTYTVSFTTGGSGEAYGRRWEPFGQYACISKDEGKTWDAENEIKLSIAPNGDLGYPSSV